VDLWYGSLPDFVEYASGGGFEVILAQKFERLHRAEASEGEVRSWKHSLRALANAGAAIGEDDVGVLVEYHLPLSECRIDAMFFGSRAGQPRSVLVELKQWTQVSLEDDFSENVLVGAAEHVHPSQQALDYAGFLTDIHSDFSSGEVGLQSCGFCHNIDAESERLLRDGRFAHLLNVSPLFGAADGGAIASLLREQIGGGGGMSLVRRVRAGRFQPSPRVIDTLAAVLERDRDWHLLDVQRKAYNRIVAEVARQQQQHKRSAVLVRGGPGTGKTVIAVQLLSEMLKQKYRAAHSTGGKAFTTALQAKFGGAKHVFTWNMSLRNTPEMELDLLLVDEAHRIRKTSDTRFTKKAERNRRSQVDELLDAAKVTVFLLDEHQYMRPDEIGETKLIVEATKRRGIPLAEYDLDTQFRCAGSQEYMWWVDWVLGFRTTPPEDWRGKYRLDFTTSPDDLDDFVEESTSIGETARLVAGFCWKWSAPLKDGTLVSDVVIGDWIRPWNRKPLNKQYKPEEHPYTKWATTTDGEEQVGCIYSAQGFEFDRVGVIWGPDLVWRDGQWIGQKKKSKDPGLRLANGDEVTRLLRNAYRVLLTRGMKGTKVLCLDQETREHLVRSTASVLELA
jgi:uncharacterized protein